MQIGLIGCGNMARALARGWGRPLLCADPSPTARARSPRRSAARRWPSNAEVARRADLVVLCHKPAQLKAVAREVARRQGRRLDPRRHAAAGAARGYPGRPVYRFIPSLPVEVRQGAVVQAAAGPRRRAREGETLDAAVAELFAELGTLVVLDDALIDVAMGLMSCGPAYVALVAEAQVDAGVRRGIPAAQGAGARGADARRDGRAAAPARLRHDRGPPRGRLAGRADGTRPRCPRARRAASRLQRRARRRARRKAAR